MSRISTNICVNILDCIYIYILYIFIYIAFLSVRIFIHMYVYTHTWDRGQIRNLGTAVEYEISKYFSLRIRFVIGKNGADTWMNCGILRGCYGLEVCKYQVCYLNPR